MPPPDQTLAYLDYRNDLLGERVRHHIRVAAAVGFSVNAVFVLLDWLLFSSHFGWFLLLRLAMAAILTGIYRKRWSVGPLMGEWLICLTLAGGMLAMIYFDGPTSQYYAGLILLLCGMGVLLPLSAREAAGICSVVLAGYVASIGFAQDEISWGAFGTNCFFLGSASGMSVASCAFLDRLRHNEFIQRRTIEIARDELTQLDEAKSRFSANVHHELRTPLTLMLAPLDAMLGGEFGELSEVQRSYLETMHKNALRLLKLINNLLDFAKIESGQVELNRQPLELSRLLNEIVASARPLAERKGVALAAECAGDLPLVNADPDALEKVVVNLVGNALKFTDAGGRITVRAVRGDGELEGGSPGVRITVADTGIGIPPDQLARVFDRFAQVDGSATRRHEGTGIGLSLVSELVGLHGGKTWATSEGLGHGTQFHVLLPVGEADDDAEEVVEADDGRSLTLRRSFDALAADLDHHAPDSEAASAEEEPAGDAAGAAEAARYRTLEMERTVERYESERRHEPRAANPHAVWRPEVVVAEDNGDMRKLLVHLLSAEFRVRAARNGREALEMVRERVPALVVTDVMMPEMSGTELCEAIKRDGDLAGVPVMLVTSKAEREMKIRGLELGADDYVTKPFHPRELVARARSLVRLRALQVELAEQNAALESALDHLRRTEVALVQSERLAAVGELAAGIAHEVNNPVNFALNSMRMLKETVAQVKDFAARVAALDWRDAAKLAESARELERLEAEVGLDEVAGTLDELVGIVIEGLDRTGRLVCDLRDFGAPGEREKVALDLRSALDSTLAMVRPLFGDRRIRVERNYAPDVPAVTADSSAIKQLFLNLLKNAADALEETGGSVRISAAASPDGREAVVSVEDDGPGIDPEQRARIFAPFFTTKAAGRGTGLGLAICRRIAEGHQGTLEVGEAAGGGALFTLRLPVETKDAGADRT
jgi:signal transduction histidine kinase